MVVMDKWVKFTDIHDSKIQGSVYIVDIMIGDLEHWTYDELKFMMDNGDVSVKVVKDVIYVRSKKIRRMSWQPYTT